MTAIRQHPIALVVLFAVSMAALGGAVFVRLSGAAEQAAFTSSDVPAAAVRPSFVVRFVVSHPLGRAQALAAQGRAAAAEAAARAAIADDEALAGLCFDRFTAGGYEVVLIACDDVARERAEAYTADWLSRFAAMSGVEYADANLIATIERAP